MSAWVQKRFWEAATIEPTKGGWGVSLDRRAVKTPAKALLVVPSETLAQAIADEWAAQDEVIDPLSMPFTRSANAAIDKVAPQRRAVAHMLAEYGDSDLLCYRAAEPAELVKRQAEAWDPLLDWAAEALEVRLELRQGIMPAAQNPAALSRLRHRTEALDAFELTAFHDLVSLSGSLIIGFAAFLQAFPIESLWQAARVDEDWQISQWGSDTEAETVALRKRAEFQHARAFLSAYQAG